MQYSEKLDELPVAARARLDDLGSLSQQGVETLAGRSGCVRAYVQAFAALPHGTLWLNEHSRGGRKIM